MIVTNSKTSKPLLLIDEQPICGNGIQRITLSSDEFILASHISPRDSFPIIEKTTLILTEISSPDRQGLTIVRELVQYYKNPTILVLTNMDETIYAERCLKAGAKGYVMKSETTEAILSALRTVASGGIHTSKKLQAQILNRMAGGSYSSNLPSSDILSDRELLIIQRIGQSRNNSEIAKELSISIKTIESHRSRIKSKLKLSTPNELVRYAVQLQASSF